MTSASGRRQETGGLLRLILWGSLLLMIAGGVIAYPTLQGYLTPTNAQDIEFVVTLVPTPEIKVLPTATFAAPPPDLLPGMEAAPPASQPTPESQPTPASAGEATAVPTTTIASEVQAYFLPSRLVIPAIGLDAPIKPVGWETRVIGDKEISLWDVVDLFAVGWHINSARPGQGGNVVLSGHHNVYGEVFRDLEHLEPLDDITVYIGETAYHYSVTALRILEEEGQPADVRKQNASCMLPTEYERLTLVTCWPYSGNSHRLIIIALPTQPME
jgi:sortase A